MRQRPSPIFFALLAVAAGGGLLATLDSSTAVTAGVVLLVLAGWAVSLCLHEFGHAYTAYRSGDTSVLAKGYLTLDIRRYTDPVLSFVLPLLFLMIGGIPLPGGAVWINRGALRSRRAESMVSFAGPFANLAIGILLVLVVSTLDLPYGLTIGLTYLAFIQVLAFLLNMLPIPGLDGFGAIEPYLSYDLRRVANQVRPWAPLAFFVVLISISTLSRAFFDVGFFLFDLIGGSEFDARVGADEFLFWR